ncbi:hypothetical protein [Scytonema millei]|uniref:Uncharacterized protein n=1 Tax=Scytonema millei VB511283 TaxID=1245923 RepID=A0A9X5EA47_9CYAN|nr:hypothetical protein [Scytonema millei]NHC36897.1 hypothetical protein [Scytonema millei VB511283]
MSIFWQNDPPNWHWLTQEERYAYDLCEWVTCTWKQLPLPLNRYQLPQLPGLYALYGEFQPSHLEIDILYRQSQSTIAEVLPDSISPAQRQREFNVFLYIGTSHSLYQRWESHPIRLPLQHLLDRGVGVSFYFHTTMLPFATSSRLESENEKKSRRELEKKLIQCLCPIFGNGRRWRA